MSNDKTSERVARALYAAEKRGRPLTRAEIDALYRAEKAPPKMDDASPLARRIQRRRVNPSPRSR